MALAFLDNFPVKFGPASDPCTDCADSFCQLIGLSDPLQFVFAFDPSDRPNLVLNGDFSAAFVNWENVTLTGQAWVFSVGAACVLLNTTHPASDILKGSCPDAAGCNNLKVSFTVSGLPPGATLHCDFDDGLTSSPIGSATTNGTHTFSAINGKAFITFRVEDVVGEDLTVCIDNVVVQCLDYSGCIQLHDTEGDVVKSIVEGGEMLVDGHFDIYESGEGSETTYCRVFLNQNWLEDAGITGCLRLWVSESNDCGNGIYSQCYEKITDTSCTKLLSWTNETDAYGFPYSLISDPTLRTHYLRVKAYFKKPQWEGENKFYTDSTGTTALQYADRRKVRHLVIERLPEYLHDALALATGHTTFQIDGADYIHREAKYEPEHQVASSLAPVTLEVEAKNQNLVNRSC